MNACQGLCTKPLRVFIFNRDVIVISIGRSRKFYRTPSEGQYIQQSIIFLRNHILPSSWLVHVQWLEHSYHSKESILLKKDGKIQSTTVLVWRPFESLCYKEFRLRCSPHLLYWWGSFNLCINIHNIVYTDSCRRLARMLTRDLVQGSRQEEEVIQSGERKLVHRWVNQENKSKNVLTCLIHKKKITWCLNFLSGWLECEKSLFFHSGCSKTDGPWMSQRM